MRLTPADLREINLFKYTGSLENGPVKLTIYLMQI